MENDPIECDVPTAPEPLRQGDVFEWLSQHRQSPWREYGLIVTADCDLFQESRSGTAISYVPVLTLRSHFQEVWMPGKLKGEMANCRAEAVKRLNRLRAKAKQPPELGADLSATAVDDWIHQRGVDGVLEDLAVPAGQRPEHRRYLNKYVSVAEALRTRDFTALVAACDVTVGSRRKRL